MAPTYPAISDSGDVVNLFNGPLFPKPQVWSSFEDDRVEARKHDRALVALMDYLEFDCKHLGALLRGETADGRGVLKHLPPVVDLSTDGEPRRMMMLAHSTIQRVLILDARARLAAWYFVPYCWSEDSFKVATIPAGLSRELHYTLVDEMLQDGLREDFIAQSLFSVDHNVVLPPPIMEFVEQTNRNLEQLTTTFTEGKSSLISQACKLFVILRNLDDPLTLVSVVVDYLTSLNIGLSLAMKTATWISEHCNFSGFTAQSNGLDSWKDMSMLAMVLCSTVGSSRLPCKDMINHVMFKLGNLGKAVSGYKTLVEVFGSVFSKVYDIVYEYIFGLPPNRSQFDLVMEELEQWYIQVSQVIPLAFQDEITIDFKKNRQIQLLYSQGLDLSRTFSKLSLNREELLPFHRHWAALQRVYDRVVSQGARPGEPRTEPVCIHIHGGSGVGKSGLTHLLSQDICSIEGIASEVCNETYFRSVEQEFWDGYHGQLVCVYDDFGQRIDSAGDPNPEFMELIRSRNIAPFPLHMAHLDEKARTKFVSRALILTSNKQVYNIGSLTCAEAIWRRIDIQVEVKVKAKYCTAGGMIDSKKVNGPLDPNVYEFILCNPLNPQMRGRVMSYDEFVTMVKDKYKQCYESSKAKLDYLLARGAAMDNAFTAQVNSINELISLDQLLMPAVWMHVRDNAPLRLVSELVDPEVVEKLIDLAKTSVDFNEFSLRCILFLEEEDIDILQPVRNSEDIQAVKNKMFNDESLLVKKNEINVKTSLTVAFNRLQKFLESQWNYIRENRAQLMIKAFSALSVMVQAFVLYKLGKKYITKANDDYFDAYGKPFFLDSKRKQEAYIMETRDEDQLKRSKYVSETKDEEQVRKRTYVSETKDEDQLKKRNFVSETKDEDQMKRKKFISENANEKFFDAKETLNKRKRGKSHFNSEATIDFNAQQLIAPFASNMYILYTWKNGEWTRVVNAIFIKGKILMLVAHARVMIKERCLLRGLGSSDGFEFRYSDCSSVILQNSQGMEIDAMLLEMPRIVCSHKDITRHFMATKDLQSFVSVPAYLISMKSIVKGGQAIVTPFTSLFDKVKALQTQTYRLPDKSQTITLREGYMYNAETEPGDCSSLLVARCPSLPRKVLGIHVAGNTDGRALSQLITVKMLEKALEKFSFEGQVAFSGIMDVDENILPELPEGDFIPVGKLKHTIPAAVKTSLRHSPLYDTWMTPKTKPALLRSTEINGELVDPLLKGLKKCGKSSTPLDNTILERCKQTIISELKKNISCNRVFSHEESILGIEGDPFLKPVNRQTSPGYPYIFQREGHRGKTKWLGSDETYILDNEELRARCEERVDAARQGIRIPAIWIDTLKDERRPEAKVDEGKTRVFSAGPMDFILVFRRYFLAFNAHMMRNCIQNECGVGVNPYCIEWHHLAKFLQGVGDNVFAGDFSNFDGTLHPDILWAVLDVVNEFYDDGEENRNIRTTLFFEIVNSIHVFRDNVYMWTHSQPSGNPFTAVLNTVYNKFGFRYVFLSTTELTLKDFANNVRAIYFGDDSVVSVSDEVRDVYNQETVEKGFKELGMVYTDETKTGNIVKWKSLQDVNFLKRTFTYDPDLYRYVAPLELDVILEMPMWVKSDLDHDDRCSTTLEKAYGELAIHGSQVFNHWTSIMAPIANELLDDPPILHHYLDYKEMDLNQF